MNICIRICRPLLARCLIVVLAAVLALAPVAWGGGVVTNSTQADLQTALNGGGTVTFGVGGVITLTNTIIIVQDTVLNAAGFDVTISGGNAVRLFQVNSNVAFSATGLTLANGRYVGADGTNGSPSSPGQGGFGAGILNLGGSVALTDCVLTNHSAQGGNSGMDPTGAPGTGGSFAPGGDAYGGGLCNLGGSLNLTNCLLTGNAASGGTSTEPASQASETAQPGRGLGAAIYSVNGQVQLQGVSMISNRAAGGLRDSYLGARGGAVEGVAGEGFGGAVYATNSRVLLSSTVLQGNIANGGATDGVGGALFLDQGSSGMIRLCRFLGNAANGAPGAYQTAGGNGSGGALFSGGAELEIWDSTFSSNSCAGGGYGAPPGGARGGSICSTSVLLINGCTFDNNLALAGDAGAGAAGAGQMTRAFPGEGGAIWSSGTLAATNSTWTADRAIGGAGAPAGGAGSGGAVCIAGGQATLVNVTIAGNSASGTAGPEEFGERTPPGPSQGGGLYNTNGTVTVLNSIIADSLSGGDVWGAVTDGGYNICSDGTAAFSATGSLNDTDPLLGPLADNGGPTFTMALLAGSPALGAIPLGFPPVDQRGVSRPPASLADIGAFEASATSPGPFIVTQPQGETVHWGTNVTLDVVGRAAAPLAYQWFKDGTAISGATNFSLTLTSVDATSGGAYSVELTSGGIQVDSQSAVLTVVLTPLIVSSPSNSVVSVGGSASFTVLAVGPSLAYQWQHNGLPIPGATNDTLVIANAQAGAQGAYQVGVSNFAGSALSPGFQLSFDASGLGILAPPPSSVTANAGDLVTLSGLVGGIAPITYQWQADGTNLPGATNSTLTFTAPALPGTYLYTLEVASAYGKLSEPVEIEVNSGSAYYWITLAGLAGAVGSADGAGSAARFNGPTSVGVDSAGNLYVADNNNCTIRKVTVGGAVTTLAGLAGAPGSADGIGSAARFNQPAGVAVDSAGNVYVGDAGNDLIRKVTPAGVVTTLAGLAGTPGSADGTGSAAQFNQPAGVAMDSTGNVYVADYANDTIRKVTPGGVVTTPRWPQFDRPFAVAVDAADNIYVAVQADQWIAKITPTGTVTILAGRAGSPGSADGSDAQFYYPSGVAVDPLGNVYVGDQGNDTVRKVTPAGAVTTLAGLAGVAGSADGIGDEARFNTPSGVAVDSAGNLYVADTHNDRIVKGVPPTLSPSVALVAGIYWMRTLPRQPNSLAVATLIHACTAPAGDDIAITSVGPSSSQGGTAQLSGSTITYTPPAGFVGVDSFSYSITDFRGASTQGTVIVAVSALPGGLASPVEINLPLPNSVVLRFAGLPGIAYHVETSSDLVHWTEIGVASALTNGWFQFIDSETRLSAARYYRTRAP